MHVCKGRGSGVFRPELARFGGMYPTLVHYTFYSKIKKKYKNNLQEYYKLFKVQQPSL